MEAVVGWPDRKTWGSDLEGGKVELFKAPRQSMGDEDTARAEATTWYVYDDLGNRISHRYRDSSNITYAHDLANRMTTFDGEPVQYSNAGNQQWMYDATMTDTHEVGYDYNNQAVGVQGKIIPTYPGNEPGSRMTYDALGRLVEYADDHLSQTTRYYYDGVNAIAEFDESDNAQRFCVHGLSYVDERLMMVNIDEYDNGMSLENRPYYYVIDRMYNVRGLVDRAGATRTA